MGINCTFKHNTASGNYGGAVFVDGGSATITGCTFDANTASKGGAVYALDASVTMMSCKFTGAVSSPSNNTDSVYNRDGPTTFGCPTTTTNSTVITGTEELDAQQLPPAAEIVHCPSGLEGAAGA